MAKRAKRQFHCERCGQPCTIYKKGKKHRVLVCPECGVLATNPFSFGKALKGVGKGAVRAIPIVGDLIAGAAEGFDGGKASSVTPTMSMSRPSNRYTTDKRVADALR